MTKIKDIVKAIIDGCTANNADEMKMNFNITYYVNHANGPSIKQYLFVYEVGKIEESLVNIIRDNVSKERDVAITSITIKIRDEIVKVNKHIYCYSLSDFMKWILS